MKVRINEHDKKFKFKALILHKNKTKELCLS